MTLGFILGMIVGRIGNGWTMSTQGAGAPAIDDMLICGAIGGLVGAIVEGIAQW